MIADGLIGENCFDGGLEYELGSGCRRQPSARYLLVLGKRKRGWCGKNW